ncbi:hypothetical protein ABEG18_07250 [Alsobacter sp. KACC 23698]|uniref:Uncharacterized protein n=1 Tax=Alsobacter sp. KACC 23698 TaxID=3149229 RepID=A0AAU7JJK5_9HYPH
MLSQADIDAFTAGESSEGGQAGEAPGQPHSPAQAVAPAPPRSSVAIWPAPRIPAVQPWFPLWWLRYPSRPGGEG